MGKTVYTLFIVTTDYEYDHESDSHCYRSLRLAYMQSGGFDPEVLAHMHDLQAEAYTLEQARTREEQKMGRRRECCSGGCYVMFFSIIRTFVIAHHCLQEQSLLIGLWTHTLWLWRMRTRGWKKRSSDCSWSGRGTEKTRVTVDS